MQQPIIVHVMDYWSSIQSPCGNSTFIAKPVNNKVSCMSFVLYVGFIPPKTGSLLLYKAPGGYGYCYCASFIIYTHLYDSIRWYISGMFKLLQPTPSPPHIASPVAHKTSHKNLVGFRHVGHGRYEGLVASQSLSCASELVHWYR